MIAELMDILVKIVLYILYANIIILLGGSPASKYLSNVFYWSFFDMYW